MVDMKNLKLSSFFVWLGIVLAGLLNSCDSGAKRSKADAVENNVEVEKFTRIEMDGGYFVTIQQGAEASIQVVSSESNFSRIRIWNQGETLRIKTNYNNVTTEETRLFITVDTLEYIKIRGGVNLETIGDLTQNELELDVEGGANIKVQFIGRTLKAKSQGGVNMEFKGSADEFIASTEGAGNIDAGKLEARYVKCRVAGVGNATVFPTEQLDATVEGIGKIGYRGDPIVNKNVNGIGMVYRR